MIRFFVDRLAIAKNREKTEDFEPPIIVEVEGIRIVNVFNVQILGPAAVYMPYERAEWVYELGKPPYLKDPAAPEIWMQVDCSTSDVDIMLEYKGDWSCLYQCMKQVGRRNLGS